jgi:hypothetical protein
MLSAGFFKRALISLIFCFALGLSVRGGDDWLEGAEIAQDSTSPNGRYGILLDEPAGISPDDIPWDRYRNILADLKAHRRLGVIRGAHYSSTFRRHELNVIWAEDSSWAVVVHQLRFDFGAITVVEPRGATFKQTDLAEHIRKALNASIARQTRNQERDPANGAWFRAGPGREILVRATADTNPKAFEDRTTYCALFLGTFDLATGKWTRSETRAITTDQMIDLEFAFDTSLEDGTLFNDEKHRLQWFDDRLNEVYSAVRLVLPAERFTAVKKEQIAWLRQLEAQDSIEKKCQFIGTRIQALRKLVW